MREHTHFKDLISALDHLNRLIAFDRVGKKDADRYKEMLSCTDHEMRNLAKTIIEDSWNKNYLKIRYEEKNLRDKIYLNSTS